MYNFDINYTDLMDSVWFSSMIYTFFNNGRSSVTRIIVIDRHEMFCTNRVLEIVC